MKAYEVLTDDGKDSEGNWKLKEKFDYYLKHPTHYYKVSGHHSIRDIPKTDVGIVLTVLVIFISIFMHFIQKQRYAEVSKKLKDAVMNNRGLKNGGLLR